MPELAELTVGHEAVVGLVREACAVGGQLVVLRRDVDNPVLAGGVEYLVGVGFILPGLGTVKGPLVSGDKYCYEGAITPQIEG
jgi:hypothetical protein